MHQDRDSVVRTRKPEPLSGCINHYLPAFVSSNPRDLSLWWRSISRCLRRNIDVLTNARVDTEVSALRSEEFRSSAVRKSSSKRSMTVLSARLALMQRSMRALERFLTWLNQTRFPSPQFSDSGFMPVEEAGMDGASIIGRSS
ncbi:hypothetical protein H5J25_00260 [Sphingomonas aliaeris]|uniref:Uncharacterized protein n=1 Tax=Sphingomonas aliaeris TaxID=2759526 RepID=A0A974S5Z4_9SPHN|nr:hypothetical protein H5J25_00260 [Sphingomonas aliaeris]